MWSPVNVVAEEEERGWCEEGAHPPQHLLKANKVLEIAMKVTCMCVCVRKCVYEREGGEGHFPVSHETIVDEKINS